MLQGHTLKYFEDQASAEVKPGVRTAAEGATRGAALFTGDLIHCAVTADGSLKVDEDVNTSGKPILVIHFAERSLRLGVPEDVKESKASALLQWWKQALLEHHRFHTTGGEGSALKEGRLRVDAEKRCKELQHAVDELTEQVVTLHRTPKPR